MIINVKGHQIELVAVFVNNLMFMVQNYQVFDAEGNL